MLIIALVLAVIGLAALVTAVVTSNELIAWVCIGASVIGVLLLIVDAVRERTRGGSSDSGSDDDGDLTETTVLEPAHEEPAAEEYPDEPVTEVHRITEPDAETVSVPTEGAEEDPPKRD